MSNPAEEKYYYKLINDETGEVECYISIDFPFKKEKVCEYLCLDGFHAEYCTKEEYFNETEEEEGQDDG